MNGRCIGIGWIESISVFLHQNCVPVYTVCLTAVRAPSLTANHLGDQGHSKCIAWLGWPDLTWWCMQSTFIIQGSCKCTYIRHSVVLSVHHYWVLFQGESAGPDSQNWGHKLNTKHYYGSMKCIRINLFPQLCAHISASLTWFQPLSLYTIWPGS